MARGRIELPTPCFSDKCSTDWAIWPIGGDDGIRTRDLLRDRQAWTPDFTTPPILLNNTNSWKFQRKYYYLFWKVFSIVSLQIVRINTLFKYLFRFVILQVTLTLLTIWYFDNFLIGDYFDGFVFISENLLEDKNRFYPFVPNDFIKIDIYLAIFVFVFLIFLYLSKFYS